MYPNQGQGPGPNFPPRQGPQGQYPQQGPYPPQGPQGGYAGGPFGAARTPGSAKWSLGLAIGTLFYHPLAFVVTMQALGDRQNGSLGTAIGVLLVVYSILMLVSFVLAIVAIVQARSAKKGMGLAVGGLVITIVSFVVGLLSSAFTALLMTGGGAHGRPLRANGRKLSTPVRAGDDWCDAPRPDVEGLSVRDREELAALWLEEARLEHASIAAFSRISCDLIAAGAPPHLVAGAHHAALQEIEHARASFALASAYAGRSITAAAFPAAASAPHSSRYERTREIRRLAVESVIDGCVGEGASARIASVASASARDSVVREMLERVARDEAGHADLSWQILDWCIVEGGEDVVRAAIEATASVAHRIVPVDSESAQVHRAALVDHGRLDARAHAAIMRATEREVTARVAEIAASRTAGAVRAA